MLNSAQGGIIREAYFFIKVPRFNVMTSHLLIIPAILVNCWQVYTISFEVVKYVDAGTKPRLTEVTENMTRCLQSNSNDNGTFGDFDTGLFGEKLIITTI